jgi:hypothetical protein
MTDPDPFAAISSSAMAVRSSPTDTLPPRCVVLMTTGTFLMAGRRARDDNPDRLPLSALERITDSSQTSRHVRKVPTGDIGRMPCNARGRQLRRPYSGRRDSRVRSNRSGSGTSQSMQRNLRPPVSTSIKCIGLPHLEHVGGGGFLGI